MKSGRGCRGALPALLLLVAGCSGTVASSGDGDEPGDGDEDELDDGTDEPGEGGTGGSKPPASEACAGLTARDLVPPPARTRRLTRDELVAILERLGAPRSEYADVLVDDVLTGSTSRNVELLTTTGSMYEGYWNATKKAAWLAAPKLGAAVGCSAENDECLDRVLGRVAEVAWRRRLPAGDIAALAAPIKALGDLSFGEKAQIGIRRMLVSPRTMYFEEGDGSGRTDANGTLKLTPFQAAEQLAFTLWQEPPDAPLLELAADAGLLEPDTWARQVDRALAEPRARAGIEMFFREWLRYAAVLNAGKDQKLYPDFGEELKADMLDDSRRSFLHLFFDAADAPSALLTSSIGFASPRLLAFLDESASAGPATVPGRAGIMTHPAMLSAFSHAATTGLITRARIYFNDVLCQSVPDPPLAAKEAVEKAMPDPNASVRERIESLTSAPACTSCHELLDPIAFSLEAYDPVGRRRSVDDLGKELDTTVRLRSFAGVSGEFDTFAELSQALGETNVANHCFATRFARHALARGLDDGSRCKLLDDVTRGGASPSRDTMMALVKRYFVSESFLARSAPR